MSVCATRTFLALVFLGFPACAPVADAGATRLKQSQSLSYEERSARERSGTLAGLLPSLEALGAISLNADLADATRPTPSVAAIRFESLLREASQRVEQDDDGEQSANASALEAKLAAFEHVFGERQVDIEGRGTQLRDRIFRWLREVSARIKRYPSELQGDYSGAQEKPMLLDMADLHDVYDWLQQVPLYKVFKAPRQELASGVPPLQQQAKDAMRELVWATLVSERRGFLPPQLPRSGRNELYGIIIELSELLEAELHPAQLEAIQNGPRGNIPLELITRPAIVAEQRRRALAKSMHATKECRYVRLAVTMRSSIRRELDGEIVEQAGPRCRDLRDSPRVVYEAVRVKGTSRDSDLKALGEFARGLCKRDAREQTARLEHASELLTDSDRSLFHWSESDCDAHLRTYLRQGNCVDDEVYVMRFGVIQRHLDDPKHAEERMLERLRDLPNADPKSTDFDQGKQFDGLYPYDLVFVGTQEHLQDL